MEELEKSATTERLPLAASPTSASSAPDIAWMRLQVGHLICACCSRRYLSQSSLSLDHQHSNMGSRRYCRQFMLDTAFDGELEMMLHEETERLVDLELLVQDMQHGTDEDAATLLARLRAGVPLEQLVGKHTRS